MLWEGGQCRAIHCWAAAAFHSQAAHTSAPQQMRMQLGLWRRHRQRLQPAAALHIDRAAHMEAAWQRQVGPGSRLLDPCTPGGVPDTTSTQVFACIWHRLSEYRTAANHAS